MKIAHTLVAFTIALGSMVGAAALTAPAANAAPCGFYVGEGNTAMYNHCGSGWITIKVRWVGMFTAERCTGPGIRRLDNPNDPGDKFISNAWYVRDGC
ncbi:DUF6355 family natural product biosynthesis protein [Allokutzneria sp. A3M-2-11 16]|uniref:DUF6355 family natural product biosynthesis protein n=1 Tax=Allokutzneria sp. A3M-2-11 16 TaxID=2962043 RepID=UPI0020B7C811|nr:DUF6355 family natural product biosynthesis protein [Allokutzneria sp. A3M-2-11 16]MCP3800241.1 DUF6355 family natural product biosynthesis protein [Allokutzneria sp. A3M-2-11 16]